MSFKEMKHLFLMAITAALATSCYPGGPEYVEDYDAVYTIINPNPPSGFYFHDTINPRTKYFMPDTVVDISEPGQSPRPIGDAKAALARVASNMAALGYTRITDITDTADADYIITVTVSRSNNYYYNYWGGWGYWYGWGGCCYYPPYATVSNIRTGSLLVDMIDYRSLDPNEENLPIVWTGGIQGLYEGSASNINNRTANAIDQMFNQSEYLNVKP